MEINGESETVSGRGNGRLNAVSNVLETRFNINYNLFMYKEHSLNDGADSTAIAYIGIKDNNGNEFFGAGIDSDIMRASIDALESAVNRQLEG